MFTDKALRKQVSLEICGVYSPFAIIFIIFTHFLIHGIYRSPFSIFRIAGHFLVSTRVKKLTKYVGNFENSQFFAGERNILNPKINSHTKTNLKIN